MANDKLKVIAEIIPGGNFFVVNSDNVGVGNQSLTAAIAAGGSETNKKADKTYVDTELAKKSDKTYVDTELDKKTDKTYVDEEIESVSERVTANTTNIAAQTARIDNIVALPEGSTTGDAELQDIRIGADGTTYDSAGDAVRGQVSDVNSELNYIAKETIKYSKFKYKELDNKNSMIYGGNIVTNNSYNYSNPIQVTKGSKITGETFSDNANVWVVTKCDSDGGNKSVLVRGSQNDNTEFTYTFDSDMYIIVTLHNGNSYFYIQTDISTQINDAVSSAAYDDTALKSEINDIDSELKYIAKETIKYSKFKYKELDNKNSMIYGGNIVTNNSYNYSNPIQVTKGSKITGETFSDNANVWVVTKCDSDGGNKSVLVRGSQNDNTEFTYTFDSDMYIIVTLHNGNSYFYIQTDISTQINDAVNSTIKIETGNNIFNYKEISNAGEWCNYTNGNIETNSYVVVYGHSGFIKVTPNTTYCRRSKYSNYSVVFFDDKKSYISGSTNAVFTTPSNCSYIIVNTLHGYSKHEIVKIGDKAIPDSMPDEPYHVQISNSNPRQQERDKIVYIGEGQKFTTINAGLNYAVENDCEVVILPGTYDLVAEGISGKGYMLPRKVVGYGAKLICNLESEDWELSPLNIYSGNDYTWLEGVEIVCSNCRYCIHDEMYERLNPYPYHNVFKNLKLTNNSNASSVLINPNCIGGGLGLLGTVEVINCIANSKVNLTISYHSRDASSTHGGGNCNVYVTGCKVNHTIGGASIGYVSGDTSMNHIYISNNLCGSMPQPLSEGNMTIDVWNNDVAN